METQRLSHGCTILEDMRTLDDQGVKADANMKLLLRLGGGMAKVKKEKIDTSAVNKATKNAKATILQKKLTKGEKKRRNREARIIEENSLDHQRLEQFARDVEELRVQALKSEGSAKTFASQLQVISDKNCMKHVLRPMRGSEQLQNQERLKLEPEKKEQKRIDTLAAQWRGRERKEQREQAEACKQGFWPRSEHNTQNIEQDSGDHGQYITQENGAEFLGFETQASGTRNKTAQQTLALVPLLAMQDAPYAQWLQQQEAKIALRSGPLRAHEEDLAYRATAPASTKQYSTPRQARGQ